MKTGYAMVKWGMTLAAVFWLAPPIQAQQSSSANYAAPPGVFANGSGRSSSANFQQAGVLGYSFAKVTSSSANYQGGPALGALALDMQPPAVPAGLTAAASGVSQINLAWSASTDNLGVTQYRVYRGAMLAAVLGAQTNYSDTGLAAGTSYTYTVQACDASGNCSAQSAAAIAATLSIANASFAPSLAPNWNLLGNSLNITLDVAAVFGSTTAPVPGVSSNITSIWKWDTSNGGVWAYYSPQLLPAQISTFAASRGYLVLASIGPGEGYWINATNVASLPVQTGAKFSYVTGNYASLPSSWNLISTAQSVYPTTFANTVSWYAPPAGGVNTVDTFVSLWAWDAAQGAWYFYSPVLENTTGAQGGLTAVRTFANSKGYLHFQDFNKTLDIGTGFWVNKP